MSDSFDSSAWTGRKQTRPPGWMLDLTYPAYTCEDCIGVCYEVGACYCAYYNAWAPDCPHPPWWARILRAVVRVVWLYPNG